MRTGQVTEIDILPLADGLAQQCIRFEKTRVLQPQSLLSAGHRAQGESSCNSDGAHV